LNYSTTGLHLQKKGLSNQPYLSLLTSHIYIGLVDTRRHSFMEKFIERKVIPRNIRGSALRLGRIKCEDFAHYHFGPPFSSSKRSLNSRSSTLALAISISRYHHHQKFACSQRTPECCQSSWLWPLQNHRLCPFPCPCLCPCLFPCHHPCRPSHPSRAGRCT